MRFHDYHNLHAGQVGWVFGRGRNTFDYATIADIAGPCFFINDAVANDHYVSHAGAYWFAVDRGHEVWLPRLRAVPVLQEDAWAPPDTPRAVWWRQDPTTYNRMPLDLMAWSRHLYIRTGTICPLIHFAWWTGVRHLNLVGCDGIHKWTMGDNDPQWDERLPNLSGRRGGHIYGEIRQAADNLMARLGILARYVGTPPA